MKISVRNDGVNVVVEFMGVFSQNPMLYWNAIGTIQAEAMVEVIQTKMWDTLKTIRAKAYEQGWKDAKAKAQKETWFGGWWE